MEKYDRKALKQLAAALFGFWLLQMAICVPIFWLGAGKTIPDAFLYNAPFSAGIIIWNLGHWGYCRVTWSADW